MISLGPLQSHSTPCAKQAGRGPGNAPDAPSTILVLVMPHQHSAGAWAIRPWPVTAWRVRLQMLAVIGDGASPGWHGL